MYDNREYQCVAVASEARISSAQLRLADYRKNGIPFDSPISGIADCIEWKEELSETIKQMLLMLIAFPIVLLLVLMVPVAYLMHLWEVRQKKHQLEKEIANETMKPVIVNTPKIKTLSFLWQRHGLNQHKYSSDERLELLSKWIEILYGKNMVVNIDLNHRLTAIRTRHYKINQPYYEGECGAPHFSFVPPVECLIAELSEELPTY